MSRIVAEVVLVVWTVYEKGLSGCDDSVKAGLHSFTLRTHAVSGKGTVVPLLETYDALILIECWPIFAGALVLTVI